MDIRIFGEDLIDSKTIDQLKNCVGPKDIGVLTADAHYGYGHPVGGAVAYENMISLSGVGFDIGCGNMAVKTDVKVSDVDVAKLMDKIVNSIGFGLGRPNPNPIDKPVIDEIRSSGLPMVRKMVDEAFKQLGTVGGGNHFVDIFKDDEDFIWVGVHFGSRGFGHKLASGFMAVAKGLNFGDKLPDEGMDAPPILLDVNSSNGQEYLHSMELAGKYAEQGREVAVATVLDLMGAKAIFTVHNHHNFAWRETHYGKEYWVVRKGCTPAFPGQLGFIGANMADDSVIIEGVDSDESKKALYSTVHGAGRVMSRRQAAGKIKWKTGEIIKPGLVNFEEVKKEMTAKGIELRGAAADEAPQVYKSLREVLSRMGDTIRVKHILHPIGVAMAPSNIKDPYKD